MTLTEKLEEAARAIIKAAGDDPEREDLKETPARFAKMMLEQFHPMTNEEIAKAYGKTFRSDSTAMVVERDIDMFSYCEHHLALMYNMRATVAYIPKGRVIGLSKIARICDAVGRRLQVQERITKQIADIMETVLGTPDVMVVIDSSHACMTYRGINRPNSRTKTIDARGAFHNDMRLQQCVISGKA